MRLCNIFAPFLICAGLAIAQQPGTPPPPASDPHASASAMTGCLSKGSAANEFILTNEAGQQTHLVGTDDLSKHLAHKIRVTGSTTKQEEKMVFRVDAVEHIADTCK